MEKKNVIDSPQNYFKRDLVDQNSSMQDQALAIAEAVIFNVDMEIIDRLVNFPRWVLSEKPQGLVLPPPELKITYSFDSVVQSTSVWKRIKKSDEPFMGYVFGVLTGLLNEMGYIFNTDYIYEPDKESVGNKKKVQNWVAKRSFTIDLEDIVKALFDKYLDPIISYCEMLSSLDAKSKQDQLFTTTSQTYRIAQSSTDFQNLVIRSLINGIKNYFNSNSDKKIKFINSVNNPLEFTITLLT